MNDHKWNKNEFIAYVLLYVAHIDLKESKKEQEYILSLVDSDTFQAIHKEFDQDNDYQSLTKISEAAKSEKYFTNLEELFAEIKLMAFADGEYHQMEQAVYNHLKKLIQP